MKGNARLAIKVLELLGGSFALSFERGRKRRRKLHEGCDVIWATLDRKQLYQVLERCKLQGLIRVIREGNRIENIRLTNKGRARALQNHLRTLRINSPQRWDKKWRLVIFDIPEKKRNVRDAFRRKLKELGFFEFQKSVFAYPYPCDDEINFVSNFLGAEEYVYTIEAPLHPDGRLRKHFNV